MCGNLFCKKQVFRLPPLDPRVREFVLQKTGFLIAAAGSSCVWESVLQFWVCRSMVLCSRMFVLIYMIPELCQLFAGQSPHRGLGCRLALLGPAARLAGDETQRYLLQICPSAVWSWLACRLAAWR